MSETEKSASRSAGLLPAIAAGICLFLLIVWFTQGTDKPLEPRVPGTDKAPVGELATGGNAILAGKLTRSAGQPADLPGAWKQFRGEAFDAISKEPTPLLRSWGSGEPRQLWDIEVGEGYAGPAVYKGRVYLMDYDREKKEDALRCLSLADGLEIWRFSYPVAVKRNHGMSRTVPAVNDQHVVAMGPKCHVVCLNSMTGELRWGIDLVKEFGTAVPPWYAGQCPFFDNGNVILAPAGLETLMMGVEADTGKVVWKTPNPRAWKMTHASIIPMEVGGERMYVYCADKGVVGVSSKDGQILWETTDWKISIATVPSPLALGDGRIFFSGGYNAGSMMMQVKKKGSVFVAETLYKLEPEVFGAIQQTPIIKDGHIYGVRQDGRFVCLTLDGEPVWSSPRGQPFGLGPFLIANGLIYAMNDSGLLRLIEATPAGYQLLAQAQVLQGRESWGPMAIVGGRLLARDFTRMVCLQVGTGQRVD